MYKYKTLALLFVAVMVQQAQAAAPVYKCVKDREVTYQSEPCAKPVRRVEPNIKKLNEERMKKLLETGTTGKSDKSSEGQFSAKPSDTSVTPATSVPVQAKPVPMPAVAPSSTFKCDGRQHCSQMTSCSEAKYFLKNCPGVKMDGDHDGIPCEDQWCKSPFD